MANETLHTGPGIGVLKGMEKCKLVSYDDNGKAAGGTWTIAWGATHWQDGRPVRQGETCTQEQADALLAFNLIQFENKVKNKIAIPLKQHEFDALVDFTYNTGGGYVDHNNKYHDYDLYHNINSGMSGQDLVNYWMACAITQGGIKLNGLIRRRRSELYLFQTGVVNLFE